MYHPFIRLLVALFAFANQKRCGNCGSLIHRHFYTWKYQGRAAILCPNCNRRCEGLQSRAAFKGENSDEVSAMLNRIAKVPSAGIGVAGLLCVLVIGAAVVFWVAQTEPGSRSHPVDSIDSPPAANASASPTLKPATTAGPVLAEAPSATPNPLLAQQAAVQRYPSLAVKGSLMNKGFLEKVRVYRQTRPEYFKSADWPVRIADEVAAGR